MRRKTGLNLRKKSYLSVRVGRVIMVTADWVHAEASTSIIILFLWHTLCQVLDICNDLIRLYAFVWCFLQLDCTASRGRLNPQHCSMKHESHTAADDSATLFTFYYPFIRNKTLPLHVMYNSTGLNAHNSTQEDFFSYLFNPYSTRQVTHINKEDMNKAAT